MIKDSLFAAGEPEAKLDRLGDVLQGNPPIGIPPGRFARLGLLQEME